MEKREVKIKASKDKTNKQKTIQTNCLISEG